MVHRPISSPTSISFIFINLPKLWLCHNLPHGYSYLEWSNMHTDIGTLCNKILKLLYTIYLERCGSALKMILLLSDFECWALLCSWQDKTPILSNVWILCKKDKENEMEEGEREKESARTESLSLFTLSSCVYWIDPLLHVSSPGWQQF